MKSKYIYIDDEKDVSVKTLLQGFNDTGIVEVSQCLPENDNFESLTSMILDKLHANDGVIIDLKLNGNGPHRVNFTATTLAQFLRSAFNDNQEEEKPIILCSTDINSNFDYQTDFTSHDLFDFIFDKSIEPKWKEIARDLDCISKAYKQIKQINTEDFLSIFCRKEIMDTSVFDIIRGNKFQASKIVGFVLHDMFTHNGLLINENTLAARLGVDIEKSGESWQNLTKNFFSVSKYGGILSDIGDYYWNDLVIKRFKEITGKNGPASYGASKRIELLKNSTSLDNLVAAKPVTLCKSDYFWTICVATNKPLDPMEGYVVKEDNDLKSWQEPLYASLIAYANGDLEKMGMSLTIAEKERADSDLQEIDNRQDD